MAAAGAALDWLAETLAGEGLKVAEVPGWRTRGRGAMGVPAGVMVHHTAGPAAGNMPSLGVLRNGRADLPGPLAQLGLGRDGTFYVVAAGHCLHAGPGAWRGVTAGNARFVAIEAENRGTGADPWPAVQLDALARGTAALLGRIGAGAEWAVGHKEWALPHGRKIDPALDMDGLRATVAGWLAGRAPPPPIPAADAAGRPTVRRGDRGLDVAALQRRLGIPGDGRFGPLTEARLRAAQRAAGLVADGIAGPATWAALAPDGTGRAMIAN